MDLKQLGFDVFFEQAMSDISSDLIPARVAREDRGVYRIWTQKGEHAAHLTGKSLDMANASGIFPAVGDWVAVRLESNGDSATIHDLLPRKGSISRKSVGPGDREQVLAANVDLVFLISGMDNEFNLRRIERYLTLAWDSGATPVVLLNKADLVDDIDHYREEVESVAFGVPVYGISANTGQGIDQLQEHLGPGITACFLGSSGVGKSTTINALYSAAGLATGQVRETDSKGRHTTTARQMIFTKELGVLIDTPGLRQVPLWFGKEGIDIVFEEIVRLGKGCRFRDCRHEKEPGCAVTAAVDSGELDHRRYESYLRQRKELESLERRLDPVQSANSKSRWKQIHKEKRNFQKQRGR